MKMFISASMLSILIAGCATQAKYQKKVESWIGHSSVDLVRSFGRPTDVLDLGNGRERLLYVRNDFTEAVVLPEGIAYQEPKSDENYNFVSYLADVAYRDDLDSKKTKSSALDTPTSASEWSPGVYNNKSYMCSTYFEINALRKITSVWFFGNDCVSR